MSGGTLILSGSSIQIISNPGTNDQDAILRTWSAGSDAVQIQSLILVTPLNLVPAPQFQITAADSLVKSGSGTLTLTGTGINLNSSTVTTSGGTLTLGGTLNLGGGTLVIGNPPPRSTNLPPVALNPTFACNGASSVAISKSAIATDPEGLWFTVSIVTPPAHGTVFQMDESLIYVPKPGFTDQDSFVCRVDDWGGATTLSTVTLTNRFSQAAGTYFGVLSSHGVVSVKIDSRGIGTFKLVFDGVSCGGTLTLPSDTSATLLLSGPSRYPEALRLQFIPGAPSLIRATVHGQSGDSVVDCSAQQPDEIASQYAGQYNVALENSVDAGNLVHGFAVFNVKGDGSVRVVGRLPNGKGWSTGSLLGEVGEVPVQVSQRTAGASLSGQIVLPPAGQFEGLVHGSLDWARRPGSWPLNVRGGRFEPQVTAGLNLFGETQTRAVFRISSPALKTGQVQRFLPGGLVVTTASQEASMPIRIDSQNRVVQLKPAPPWMTLVIKKDGRFDGTYVAPASSQFLHVSGLFTSRSVNGIGVVTSSSGGYVTIEELSQGD